MSRSLGDHHHDADHDEPDYHDGNDHSDRGDEPDGDEQRFADHVADYHHAGATGRPAVDADVSGTGARAVPESVALTGTHLDHRYTGVP